MKYSIIIPNLNNVHYLVQAVSAVMNHTEDYELIVVDNASTDGSREYVSGLKKVHSNIRCIELKENKGFCGAMNTGLRSAKGDFLVWLNNDTLVTPNWLPQMNSAMRRYEKKHGLRIGLVGPATNFAGGRQQAQGIQYTPENVDRFAEGFHKAHIDNLDETGFLSGFCIMMKRKLYEEVGDLDEAFFPGGFEDNDYLLRANEKGWYALIAGDTFVHHYGSKTLHSREFLDQRGGLVNRLKFYKKWEVLNRGEKRLVAMYRVKDPDEYFVKSLNKTSEFADAIVVLVDNPGPKDQTVEICKQYPKVVRIDVSTEPFDERRDRNNLVRMAVAEEADWIVSIDDDEVFEDSFSREKAQQLMHPPNPHVKMYGFHWKTFFNGSTHFRTDGIFGNMYGYRMVKVEPNRSITGGTEKGLHCFVPGSLVTCLDEDENVIQRAIELIKEGDRVLTASGKFHSVVKTHKRFYEGYIRGLTYWGGQSGACTPNHEAHTSAGKIEVSELKVCDEVNTCKIVGGEVSKIRSNEEMLFLGYFLGDGYINRGLLSIACNVKHVDRIQEIKSCAEELKFNVSTDTQDDYHVTRVQCYKRKDLREEFLLYTKPKRIPLWAFTQSEDKIGKLLRGLFLSDGFVRQNKWPTFAVRSVGLAFGVYHLLRTVGISATVYFDTSSGFDGGSYEFYKVVVYAGICRKKFSELTDIDFELPQKVGSSRGSPETLQIRKVEEREYSGYVYNLSVEIDHSYNVCGAVYSNCGNLPPQPAECLRFTGIRIKHYGYCSPEKCRAKYEWYQRVDDEKVVGLIGQEDYGHLVQKRINVYPWEEKRDLTLLMAIRNGGDQFCEILEHMAYFADKLVIGDTGSTDDSMKIAKMYGAKIYPTVFQDNYSKLKNQLIDKCETQWILLMDYDESFDYPKIPRISNMMDTDWDGYMFQVLNHQPNGQVSFSEAVRLFRNIPEMRYTGRVHENFDDVMFAGAVDIAKAEFPLHHYGFTLTAPQMDAKLEIYKRLNEMQMKDFPKDARAPFNLALHYLNEGNYTEGMKLLKFAIALNPQFYQPKKELGLSYIRMGQKWLQEALATLPADHLMRELIQRILQSITSVIGEQDLKIGTAGMKEE